MTTTNSNPLSITALSDYDGPTMNKNPMKVTIVGGGGGDGGEPIAVAKDGVDVTDTLSTLDFIGDNIEVTDAGSGHIQVSVESSGGGGGGTPGGDDTQVQFNNNGSFGGIDILTYDGTDIGLSGDISVDASTAPIFIGNGTFSDMGTKDIGGLFFNGATVNMYSAKEDGSQSLIAGLGFGAFVVSATSDGDTTNISLGPDGISSSTISNTKDDSATTSPVNILYTDTNGLLKSLKPPASGTYTLQSVNGTLGWVSI